MDTVRRSLRVGRSKLGTEPVSRSTPAIEPKKTGRQLSGKKVLIDVTNTCDSESNRSRGTRVASKQGECNELGNRSALKPAVDLQMPSITKNKKKVTSSKTVSSSSSLSESKTTTLAATAKDPYVKAVQVRKIQEKEAVVGSKSGPTSIPHEVVNPIATLKENLEKPNRVRKAKDPRIPGDNKSLSTSNSLDASKTISVVVTPKDPVVKVCRSRKIKGSVELQSNSGITHVSDGVSIVFQGTGTVKQNTIGPSCQRLAQVGSTQITDEDIGAVKEKIVCDEQSSISHEQQHRKRIPRSTGKSSGLGEAHSEAKTTFVKPKRVYMSSKGLDATSSNGKKMALPLKGKKIMGRKAPAKIIDMQAPSSLVTGFNDSRINIAMSGRDTNCIIESFRKVSLKVSNENQGSANRSTTEDGLVTPRVGASDKWKNSRTATPKSDYKHLLGSGGKSAQKNNRSTVRLESSGVIMSASTELIVNNVLVGKPALKKRTKKNIVMLSGKTAEGAVGGEDACPAGGQGQGEANSRVLNEVPTGASKSTSVQQSFRRNATRGARKPVNYAEEDNLVTSKISSVSTGTSMLHSGQTSTKVGAPTVQQATRRGRRKVEAAVIAPTHSCIENPLRVDSEDLNSGVIAIPTTIVSSSEQENDRFKLKKYACENVPKDLSPAATTKSTIRVAESSIQLPSSIMTEKQCSSSVHTIDVEKLAPSLEDTARTPTRKFIHASRTPKAKIQDSPNLPTAGLSEQSAHITVATGAYATKSSSSGEVGIKSPSSKPPLKRGQKRGRRENKLGPNITLGQTSDLDRLLIDAAVDAKPNCFVHLRDVNAFISSDDLEKYNKEISGVHELYEQVDKGEVVAEDDPDQAVFEHEDQSCVNVSGKECNTLPFKPLASFDDADISKRLKDCCKTLGKPSPLQAHAIPFLLASRDLVAVSESHAGFVQVYGMPVIQHAVKKKKSYVRKRPSPLCLVLATSSDHARQITESLKETYGSLRVNIASAVENSENVSKMESVKPGVAILVSTPHCLQKMLEDGSCSLALVAFIVLDGADCMLNNGCEASLQVIFDQAPASQLVGVFSSTCASGLEQLVQNFVPNSDVVKIIVNKSVNITMDTQDPLPLEQDVHQIVEVIEESNRDTSLTSLLRSFQKGKKNRVLVYVLYKEEALHVEGLLQQRGWKVASVHGGIFEPDRNKAVFSFQNGSSSVLVATDVAARGLAIPNVDYVINYSFPYTLYDYARRLGQIGRTGQRGIMHTFFLPSNQARA